MKLSRRARLSLIVLGLVLFTGYFAFSTFVFDPLERPFGRIEEVVPRDVDFYVRKTGLSRDFPQFPAPAFFPALEASLGWSTFLRSELFRELDAEHRLTERLAELDAELDRVPLDPVRDFLGREFVLAGRFTGPDLAKTDFALYTRVSWKVKAALAALRFPWIRERFAAGLPLEAASDDTLRLGRALGGRDLHAVRDHDLLLAATNFDFLRAARDLQLTSGQDSLGLSARFHDAIVVRRAPPEVRANELEVFLDLEALGKHGKVPAWPDPEGSFECRLAANFFQTSFLRNLAGLLRFGPAVEARLRCEVNTDRLGPAQKKVYGASPQDFGREIVGTAGSLAPRRTALVGAFYGDVAELGRAVYRSLDRDTRKLADDQFRVTGKYVGLAQAIEEFAAALRDRVVVLVRRNEFERAAHDPPNDGGPAPCFAFAFWMSNPKAVEDLVDFFIQQRVRFGFANAFQLPVSGQFRAYEFWSQLVPGTGEIAVAHSGDLLLVANSYKFIGEIFDVWYGSAAGRRLADDAEFQEAVADLAPSTNLFAYANPRALAAIARDHIGRWVEEDFAPDFATERPKAIARIREERYPQHRGKPLPRDAEEEVQRLADAAMESYRLRVRGDLEPRLRQRYEDRATWLESLVSIAATLRADARRLDLAVRAKIEFR